MTTTNVKYCYSWDDENFNVGPFNTIEQALLDATEESGKKGVTVYIGEVLEIDNTIYFPTAEYVIEYMGEQAYDHIGELAYHYPDVTDNAKVELEEELRNLLTVWCKKYEISPAFYSVTNVQEYKT